METETLIPANIEAKEKRKAFEHRTQSYKFFQTNTLNKTEENKKNVYFFGKSGRKYFVSCGNMNIAAI